MSIYLVQHGQCLSKQDDPKRGLSEEGTAEVIRIAQVAADYRVQVDRIVHSGKNRALQTAQILAEALNPEKGVAVADGMNPLDDAAAFAASLDMASNCMVVGHLPHLEKLVSFMVTGQELRPVFKLQNGGILCLGHYEDTDQVIIRWALMPNVC